MLEPIVQIGAKFLQRMTKRMLPRVALQKIRRWRLRRHLTHFKPYVIEKFVGNRSRKILITDSLAKGWYDRDIELPPEIELLRNGKLRPGAIVYDLGAHQGVVAMMLAAEVGDQGQVLAVEATAHNAYAATQNVLINEIHNITVIRAVAGQSHGVNISFNETLNGTVDTNDKSTYVNQVSVDGLARLHGKPDVIYVDVEGFETQVLSGAEVTFESKPDWFIEVHVNHGLENFGSLHAVLQKFGHGYDLFIASNSEAFQRFSPNSPILRDRFYLVAIGNTE